jgi:hypothetical protein
VELTEYEKREVLLRGWPSHGGWPDRDVLYVTKRRYDQDANDWALVRYIPN